MGLLALGLSHRSAPVDLLDRAALTHDAVNKLLADIRTAEHVAEAAVVATCNRVELYADVARFHGGLEEITDLLVRYTGVPTAQITPHLYVHYESRAVHHLFSVAAGLDSMVMGESQILGQVRQALHDAQAAETAGRALNDLFQNALRVGKRVHAETGIDAAGRSLVTVALALVAEHVGPLSGLRALVIGAGSTAALAAATLHRSGARVVVASRSLDRGARVAVSVDGTAMEMSSVPDALPDIDVVVSCTDSTGTVLSVDHVAGGLGVRAGRPLGIVDLALPHDVEPDVASLPGVERVDLAMIAKAAGSGAAEADVFAARDIVAEEVAVFVSRQRSMQAAPTIVALRSLAEEIVGAELTRLDSRLPDLDLEAREEVARSVRRVVDKLLHAPTVRVKELAAEPGGQAYASALRELFALDPRAVEAVVLPEEPGSNP
jgi:glutamyl-tRNA reductase